MGKLSSDSESDLVFLGPGISNQVMDMEFKRLYDSLIAYKNNVFHLVDTLCTDCEARDRLALNIAERDSALVQRLVAKEVSQRNMRRNIRKNSDEQEEESRLTVKSLLQTRSLVMNDSADADGGD
ncbi:hypothetical protein KQH65_01240 [archaeon]|nr:hypothetical protein [archaeon]